MTHVSQISVPYERESGLDYSFFVMRDDFEVDTNPPQVKGVFDYVQGRIAFNADIFWTKSSIGQEAIDLWLETYQMTRDFESRGIVEVTINDKE